MSATFTFLQNKYTKWYFSIISNAQHRDISGYTEKHHIIPKSLGGSNKQENLVKLTAREHFICHWLLTKMIKGELLIKMKRALWRMLVRGRNFQERYIPNSRTYETLRLQFGSLRKGVVTSSEVKEKISIANKGKLPWNKGIARSSQDKLKISVSKKGKSNGHIGMKRTKETKLLQSLKAKSRQKIQCCHCNTESTPPNYVRWHGNNCKHIQGELKFLA